MLLGVVIVVRIVYVKNAFGHTNNGYYDVRTILNEPIEVNIRNVCLCCYADNRIDMGARHQTAKIVNHTFQCADEAETDINKLKCKVCNSESFGYRCPTDHLQFHEYKYSLVTNFLKNNKIDSDIKLYYMIDDCLSCT